MSSLKPANIDRLTLSKSVIASWAEGALEGAAPHELRRLIENEMAAIERERASDPGLAGELLSECQRLLGTIGAKVN